MNDFFSRCTEALGTITGDKLLACDIQRLKDILANVNQLQRFAEAKHGSLVAITIAILSGLLNVINKPQYEVAVRYFCMMAGGVFLGSVFVSLCSFYPRTKNNEEKQKPDCANVNLYFFGDIQKLDTESYLQEMQRCYGTSPQLTESYEAQHLANQVIINSRITQYKFELFKVALFLFCLASAFTSYLFIYEFRGVLCL